MTNQGVGSPKKTRAESVPGFRTTRARAPLWIPTLAAFLVFAAVVGASWLILSHPAVHVSAQAAATPTPVPRPVRPDTETWRAIMEQRAPLPASVNDFHDLLTFVSSSAPTGAALQTPMDTQVLTLTQKVYLPLVRRHVPPSPPRPLGEVTLHSGQVPCEGDAADENEVCYEVQVACSQLAESRHATLRVGKPAGVVEGTVVFASGWDGTYFWGGYGGYRQVVEHLRGVGYRTVEIRWHSNWWLGASGQLEGHAKLACRPATLIRWIYDHLHEGASVPFCAAGHSNGASQVAYPITQYGLADILAAVLLESGPNYARIDHACIKHPSDPALQALFWDDRQGRGRINWSLGLSDQHGACVDQEESYRDEFEEASLAFDWGWQYQYPDTTLAFVFGEEDLSRTAVHGAYYYSRVDAAGSPLLSMDVVTGTGHWVAETELGRATMQDRLVSNCRLP